MTDKELCDMCEAGLLTILETTENIISVKTSTGLLYDIDVKELPKISIEELTSLCRGEREVEGLRTFSRVVGYYSAVNNWNRSKLGELTDRRKGLYDIADQVSERGNKWR